MVSALIKAELARRAAQFLKENKEIADKMDELKAEALSVLADTAEKSAVRLRSMVDDAK